MNAPPAALLDGRYQVGPVLARGGMSTVYRGTDIRLDRPVAVKVMEPRLAADPVFRARFEREARSAARIDHPAVVDVHDQGEDVGGPGGPTLFLVMELVEGGTLRDVLRARGALGVPAAFAVMEPVLAGLAEAHRLGLVHRDVKPENVLISRDGEVKVADFGLVTAAAQAGTSHAGMIMGTVAYLSPEQVATGQADQRSDVYSAGVLLYELLTGAPPYSGDTAISVAYRHVNSDVPAPSLIAGDVPPELDEFVLRATRRDPAARPADAAAMLAELHRVAVRLDVPRVHPPVPPPRPIEEQDTVPAGPRRTSPGPATHRIGAPVPAGPGGTRTMPRTEAGPEGPGHGPAMAAHGPPPHLRARRRSRRVFAVWIAIVVALALVVGFTGWWLGVGRWTAMPSVVGLEQQTAQQLVGEADLVVRITEAPDDGVAAGLVAASSPPPEARLLRGSVVDLTVSAGRPTVPAVAPGTAVAAAEQAVRDAGLTPVQASAATEYSSSVPAGTVVRTDPGAGTALPVGGQVTLVVSRGPQPEPERVRVPLLIGQRFSDAREALEGDGLEAEENRGGFPFRRENGVVIGQQPGAGSLVDPGTTVTLDTI